MKEKSKCDELINAHWVWLEGFLNTIDDTSFTVETIEYIYKTAFVHGYKHASTELNKKEN